MVMFSDFYPRAWNVIFRSTQEDKILRLSKSFEPRRRKKGIAKIVFE
jgi:hypothetical protein